MPNPSDSEHYLKRKQFYNKLLTVYGRKPVLEALKNTQIQCHRLHIADTNKTSGIIEEIKALAKQRNIEMVSHSREALARISKNRKQDQGIAVDLLCPQHQSIDEFTASATGPFNLLAVDGITNPQNLGMIIRSVAASPMTGLLLANKGNTGIGPLAIKASAGAVFNCPIVRCEQLQPTLIRLQQQAEICVLAGDSQIELKHFKPVGSTVYVLGNETTGVSEAIMSLADQRIKIPMSNNIESLNVAIAAALIAFRDSL